jgi:guanylate kinase
MLIILCGNTAVGKDTYQNLLLERNSQLKRAISHTTRPIRPQEVGGREYYFVSSEIFYQMIRDRKFMETRVYSTIQNGEKANWFYGLTYDEVPQKGAAIAIVDHQGILEILHRKGDTPVKIIYMQAPDEELRKRSSARLDESAEFERRLDDDKKEFTGIERVADLIINTNSDDHESNLKAIESLLEV